MLHIFVMITTCSTLRKSHWRMRLIRAPPPPSPSAIYTYVGDILVAVNPYADLGIYGAGFSAKYSKVCEVRVTLMLFGLVCEWVRGGSGAVHHSPTVCD